MKEYNYTDIKRIDSNSILFYDGYILEFDECKREWASEKGLLIGESLCVASRNILDDNPYFLFYTKEKVRIHFRFKGLFTKKRCKNKFQEMQVLLNRFGYSSYDLT